MPKTYTPDTLYEYIDGAADVFLSFDFQKLASLTYENHSKSTITVDIYRHNSERNGFGIYSQEKPQQGNFLSPSAPRAIIKGRAEFLQGQLLCEDQRL